MMKHWSTLILLLFMTIAVHAQTTPAATPAQPDPLELKENTHDFGKIPQGRPVTHDFVVKNNGTKPLVLEHVQASCGCTTPEWSKEPIMPGKTTIIKVGFNAAAAGKIDRTVTILYNANQTKVIAITGVVYAAPATSAPVNASLALLKYNNN